MEKAIHRSKVLIVDDDKGLSRLIEKTVRREGHATALAHTAHDAAAWLRENQADLLLLDLKLPDASGIELISRMQAECRQIPFVIITGQGDERVAVDLMRRGALDYVVKDVQFMEFLPVVVHRALAQLERERRLKTAELALYKEHLFGNAVLAAAGAAMIVFDAACQVVRTNRAFRKAAGYERLDADDKGADEDVSQVVRQPTLMTLVTRVRDDRRTVEEEGVLITQNGEVRSMAWAVSAIQDPSGEVEFVIASGIDITERRQLQREVLDISEREKRRIGHDIHDGLGQVLTGVDMLIKVLQKRLAQSSPGDAHAVGNISGYVQDAIKQARMLAQGLSPVELQEEGLMNALKGLAGSTATLFKVACSFRCDPPVLVEGHAHAVQVYRIAQEAISNAVKHGEARHIEISLENTGNNHAVLRIQSDGRPFAAPEPQAKTGMGLRTMKYRAEMIGARLVIRAGKSKGAEVVCEFAPRPTSSATPAEGA